MNDVESKEQRNSESRFARGDLLQLTGVVRAENSEEGADATCANHRFAATRRARSRLGAPARQLIQLSDFLLESHQSEDRIGEVSGDWRGVWALSVDAPIAATHTIRVSCDGINWPGWLAKGLLTGVPVPS